MVKTLIRTNIPTLPKTRAGVRLVINGLASHFKGRFFRVHQLEEKEGATDVATITETTGVVPASLYTGKYYETDLSLGLTEAADDITIKSAVCKVTLTKQVVETAITGRDGTVKELISANDFEVEATVTLINTVDEYPADAMRTLSDLARKSSSVYVDSEFLRLFDIDRAVVSEMTVDQSTEGNTQEVKLTLKSDEDYEVEVAESV